MLFHIGKSSIFKWDEITDPFPNVKDAIISLNHLIEFDFQIFLLPMYKTRFLCPVLYFLKNSMAKQTPVYTIQNQYESHSLEIHIIMHR